MLLEILHSHGGEVEELILHGQKEGATLFGRVLVWRLSDVPHNALDLVQNLGKRVVEVRRETLIFCYSKYRVRKKNEDDGILGKL